MFQKPACGCHGANRLSGTSDTRKQYLDLSQRKPFEVLEQMVTERHVLPLKSPHSCEVHDRWTAAGQGDTGKEVAETPPVTS